MNRAVVITGALVATPILLVLGSSFGRDPHEIRTPMVGRTAPVFTLRDVLTNEAVALASFRGKPVVINFWATWCVPCLQEHATLVSAARALGSHAQFIGVVYQDSQEQVVEFLDQRGSAYPSVLDEDARAAIAYGVYGVPETFFVDRMGTIAAKHMGVLTPDALASNLRMAEQ
jgi:cytochrome c biogenesis protein CcmG/thiol:disulfide interchange protein DsbE